MKKSVWVLSALLSVSLLTGCAGTGSGQKSSDKLSVTASFYPLYDFAVKLGGDKADVTNLTPSGVEPHDWEPSSNDMITLENADILVYNGSGMESWTDSALSALNNKDLIVVEASKGLSDLTSANEEGSGTSADPHVWLDPECAKAEMKAILDAYIKADPENEAYYQANYDKYAAEFDQLDKEFSDTLSGLSQKNIVVAHEAFGYLCRAYGLTQMPIEGLSADSEPSSSRMSEIIDFVRENNVKVIFFEELVSPKVAEAIAKETGSRTAVLNPLEGITAEQQKAGEDYFSLMRQNLATLASSLAE